MDRVAFLMTLCVGVKGGPLVLRPMLSIAHFSGENLKSIIPDPSLPPPAVRRKPLCGPIRLPDLSCEELTTCWPVPVPSDGNNDLHQQGKTVCIPLLIESKKAYRRPVPAGDLRQAQQRSQTTSTMAPFVHGTPPKYSAPLPEEMLKCDKVASCREHKW